MTGYKGPRRFNVVSILLVVIGIAAIYSLIQFGPPYWRKWKVKETLSSSAARLYPKHRVIVAGMANDFVEKVRKDTADTLRNNGVEDSGMRVNISVTAAEIVVSADYREHIRHPLVGKTTTLQFHPRVAVAIMSRE